MRCNAILALSLVTAIAVIVPGCSGAKALPVMDRPPAVTASAADVALAQSSNAEFAAALYRRLADERPGENLFFSPFSISSALLIATEGASGKTADEMAIGLHVPQSLRNTGPDAATLPWLLTDLHKGQAAIYYRLSPEPLEPELRDKIDRWRNELAADNSQTAAFEQAGKWDEARQSQAAAEKLADSLNLLFSTIEPYESRAANALWLEKTYPFRSAYLDTIHKFYGDVAIPVDFQTAADAARGQINQWVAQQTHDRITNLLAPGSVDSLTQLVITNAVYFKGEWLKPFEASATRPVDFHLAGGKSVPTPTMTEYLDTGYGAFNADGTFFKTPHEIPVEMADSDPSLYPDAHGFTAIRLAYKGDKMFMAIFVPQAATGLPELECVSACWQLEILARPDGESHGEPQRAQVQVRGRVSAGSAAPGDGYEAGLHRAGTGPARRGPIRPHDRQQRPESAAVYFGRGPQDVHRSERTGDRSGRGNRGGNG